MIYCHICRGGFRVLVGRPKGKRPLGIPRGRWKDDNNNINYKVWDGKAWD